MTSASLRPYLSLIPPFKYLSRDEQMAVAQQLVSRQLAGGETLDLRGGNANVLCIVTRGKIKVETCLRDSHVLRSELTTGQWAGQGLIIGWSQALRTRLTADGGDAGILLLWQRDLAASPVFGKLVTTSLRPYLSPIPLFKYLSRDKQMMVAQRLVSRQLAGGETLDLRGSRANVLCIVTRGKVKVETCLRDSHVLRSELTTGQWAGQGLIIGWSQALRTRLTADGGDAGILLLWQRDLAASPVFGKLVTLVQLLPSLSSRSKSITEGVRPKAASALKLLSSKALKHPVVAGTLIALALFVGFLLFTRPGKSLQADWKYLRIVHQVHLSQEKRSRQLSRILHLVPNHPSAMVELGNVAAQSSDFEAARLRYVAVADMNGAGANNLGVLLLKQGNPAAALQTLILSTQLEPDIAVTYQNLGIAYQQLGQQREAIRAFKEALRIDPNLTVARYHLGMHYLSQGAFVEAGAAFERMLEQDGTCAPAYIGLGLVQMEIGNLERAVHAFRQATRLNPNSVVAQFYLGWAQARMGNEAEAEATLKQVLKLQPPQDLLERVNIMLGEGASDAPEEVPMDSGP